MSAAEIADEGGGVVRYVVGWWDMTKLGDEVYRFCCPRCGTQNTLSPEPPWDSDVCDGGCGSTLVMSLSVTVHPPDERLEEGTDGE